MFLTNVANIEKSLANIQAYMTGFASKNEKRVELKESKTQNVRKQNPGKAAELREEEVRCEEEIISLLGDLRDDIDTFFKQKCRPSSLGKRITKNVH